MLIKLCWCNKHVQIERIILWIDYDRHRSSHFSHAVLSTHIFYLLFLSFIVSSIPVCSQCSIVKLTELILWYMNLMNNGQMYRDNENPTQHLPWWLRKTTKKPQSGWSAPGFEPGTSRMRVSCFTMEPPRSVHIIVSVENKVNLENNKK